MLDLDFVRAQFPAFASPGFAGQAHFENAGGSYPCGRVVDRLTRFYTDRKVQPYHPFPPSEIGGAEMDEARTRLAEMMGVAEDEVSFGPSTSANTYVLAQAVRQWMGGKGAIVVTNQDHEANSGVWRRLADSGVEGCWTPLIWRCCWRMGGCGWWLFRIVPTWWRRSMMWRRSAGWRGRRARGRWWTGCLMRRTGCRIFPALAAMCICFRPTRLTGPIRGS
jgi:hypothetical protein